MTLTRLQGGMRVGAMTMEVVQVVELASVRVFVCCVCVFVLVVICRLTLSMQAAFMQAWLQVQSQC